MPNRREFDAELVAIMGRAFDAAWAQFDANSWVRSGPEKAGVRRGQRDPERLRDVALHVVWGTQSAPAANWRSPSGRAGEKPQL